MENLIERLLGLKEMKKDLDAEIREIESKIETINSKVEGTESQDFGKYKVSVSKKLTRTLDIKAYKEIEDSLPEKLRPVIYKPAIDLKVLRALELVDDSLTANFITTKPAKSQIKIKINN